MCGRFYLDTERKEIARYFDVGLHKHDFKPRYNITPSQPILTITQDAKGRQARNMRWGLVPIWAKKIDSRYSMINARAESIDKKPAYKRPFLNSRCLIPASGFYEWKQEDNGKQPYCITMKTGQVMAFAGIWETWHGPEGDIHSCSIVTTEASTAMKTIHDRMPVILADSAFNHWLDPNNHDIGQLRKLLQQTVGDILTNWPVSTAVNSPANNGPDLIKPI